MLSNAVPARRLGAAFGIKQSAPPATTMMAGLSVPLLAVTLGWRAGYLTSAVLAAIVAVAARRTWGNDDMAVLLCCCRWAVACRVVQVRLIMEKFSILRAGGARMQPVWLLSGGFLLDCKPCLIHHPLLRKHP
jgi:MFS family permease